MSGVGRLLSAFTRNQASTAPDADDPRLRGRTYAIPFDRVWELALALADGGLRRWHVLDADDQEGVIHAEAHAALFRTIHDVTIRIGLDADAQTRVDAQAAARTTRGDLGASARRIAAFFRALDRALARPATTALRSSRR
ncbi:MAG TPA: DUF1499 domain-containing protein [Longimicrobiales bacterium]